MHTIFYSSAWKTIISNPLTLSVAGFDHKIYTINYMDHLQNLFSLSLFLSFYFESAMENGAIFQNSVVTCWLKISCYVSHKKYWFSNTFLLINFSNLEMKWEMLVDLTWIALFFWSSIAFFWACFQGPGYLFFSWATLVRRLYGFYMIISSWYLSGLQPWCHSLQFKSLKTMSTCSLNWHFFRRFLFKYQHWPTWLQLGTSGVLLCFLKI